jgi:hypothetical protein
MSGSKSEAQLEKDRKRKEHQQKILKQHGGNKQSSKQQQHRKDVAAATQKSAFSELFVQRASGFQIDFRFRNAPPRPPVGPTFVGQSLDAVLQDHCRQYKPFNSVEANYTYKLHSESDLGVPLAPSAMDLGSYETTIDSQNPPPPLEKADAALLDWQGSMGDSVADSKTNVSSLQKQKQQQLQQQQQQQQKTSQQARPTKPQGPDKKAFSRVLNEGMQTWMKKTTYLSNDYSRKVHDFKSLAKTKQEIVQDLDARQVEITKLRAAPVITKSFDQGTSLQHPTNKNLKPKSIMQLLPNVDIWGQAYTHLVIDKRPNVDVSAASWSRGLVADWERKKNNQFFNCNIYVPEKKDNNDDNDDDSDDEDVTVAYKAVQSYDLDVVPLKTEDVSASTYCLFLDRANGVATYQPMENRVQLSTGRPAKNRQIMLQKRPLTSVEQDKMEVGKAVVDKDLAEKHQVTLDRPAMDTNDDDDSDDDLMDTKKPVTATTTAAKSGGGKDDDGEGDFGDDDDSSDSGDEALFGGKTKTIVAEG